jgi:cytochrome c oxidase subunit 2
VTGPAKASAFRKALLVAPLALLVDACATNAPMDSLAPAGPEAHRILNLSTPVFIIAGVVFVLVEAAIVLAAVKFRDHGDDSEPRQIHGNNRLELLWTIIPALILAGIAIPTVKAVVNLTDRPQDGLQIQVTGHQWWFQYTYPEQNFTTANVLVIPVGTPIDLEMTSADVVHSFWVPRLAGKRDVIPGQTTFLKLQADEIGEYWGQCAEFCGLGHANMRIRVEVLTEDDYNAWLTGQQQPAVEPDAGSLAATGKDLFLNKGCVACHVIQGVSDSASTVAPDLTHIASRDVIAGASLQFTEDDLKAWLADPPYMKPGSYMPNLHLSSDEIDALIAYLEILK